MRGESLHLSLAGFEGPLDLLLELARAQKVDIRRISILALVDQYVAALEGARRLRLEVAAEWLVMAAWLTWLKSRLLLPEQAEPEEEALQAAERLTEKLAELDAMRRAAAWLAARAQLGREIFARGQPEALQLIDRSGIVADLPALLRAYAAARRRALAARPYRPKPRRLWSVAEALQQLRRLIGTTPGWVVLQSFLPEGLADGLERRAALASGLVAALEEARSGALELRQDAPFGPLWLRRAASEPRAAESKESLPDAA
ncbi:MAG: ScpA family protein [Rhodovarius sp.]|nr:segregation/condensation protein A [Rhodovarius sp.]MCX7931438.1 segregation/condensation protein A [Rhodovarius sp.]MDW8315054.1 ScpA family protein [Rhodovarius sp.]